MSERAISVRLDDESEQALEALMRQGRTRSQAIREALVAARAAPAGRGRGPSLREEAERLAADLDDRAEAQAVAELMESLRAAR